MQYLNQILEFFSWPVFIIISYQLIKYFLRKLENKNTDSAAL